MKRSNSLKATDSSFLFSSYSNIQDTFINSDDEDNSCDNSDPGFTSKTQYRTELRTYRIKYPKSLYRNCKHNKKKILVLDLDDTLIHSIRVSSHNTLSEYTTKSNKPSKIQWVVKLNQSCIAKLPRNSIFSNQDLFLVEYNIINLRYHRQDFYVCERPNVREFLGNVCNLFEVYIYTSGDVKYAKPIIDDLCPVIDESHRKYGDLCKIKFNRIYKDLYSFNCPFSDIMIVDDNQENLFFWPRNAIVCKPFSLNNFSNNSSGTILESDLENIRDKNEIIDGLSSFLDQNYLMEKLWPILEKCASAYDIRSVINSQQTKLSLNSCFNDGFVFIGSPKSL